MSMVGQSGAGRGPDHEREDVFPFLLGLVAAGIVLGMAVAVIGVRLIYPAGGDLVAWGAIGASLGAIAGLFVGLGKAVWRPGEPLLARDPVPPSPQLWDPWLDSGHDAEWVASEGEPVPCLPEEPAFCTEGRGFLCEARAMVRPRVISPETREVIPLEEEIGPLIQAGRTGYVRLVGGPGSGKSTALRHLAAMLPPWARDRVRLVDRPHDSVAPSVDHHLVIAAQRRAGTAQVHESPCASGLAVYHLALWGQDDLIEYLLAAHRDRCASVMSRLKTSGPLYFLEGIPELWTCVLDWMASDDSIGDLRTALRRELAARFGDRPALRALVEDSCLTAMRRNCQPMPGLSPSELPGGKSAGGPLTTYLYRLVRHRPVALLLAADRVAEIVESGRGILALTDRLPRDLIQEAGPRIAASPRAMARLQSWLHPGVPVVGWPLARKVLRAVQPTAASLLHAATPGWRPDGDSALRLKGAYLDAAAWSGLTLARVNLSEADLSGADLSQANLEAALADRARFHRADLHGATLTSWRAEGADLSGADLRSVNASFGRFRGANLGGAALIQANLSKADLRGADIASTDFTEAQLYGARLDGLTLRLAQFGGAHFGGAQLSRCDLEEMTLPDADFHDANLRGALLTGSQMPRAKFLGADLRDAGLAEVDWPGAALLNADLRGASFHLGSSRNGLVGSPIACEGSRTGFYTDDFHDRDVKPAEEIRKANLRGADLRGARIQDVDFYLVDLRDARYTQDQAEHLHRCRAIL
jgi:uncharacterized protein YjbI with pentapeptide repeats